MKFWFSFFLLIPTLLSANCGYRKQIKIAVIDTGLNLKDPRFTSHLCPTGHQNFVENETLDDINDHGTFVAGLIKKYAKDANYCMLIYKYYSANDPGQLNMWREVEALQTAINNGADIVNYSGGGQMLNEDEALLIKYHPEITFVVAAGNDGENLDIPGNTFYPASLFYPNMEVVENVDKNGNLDPSSNYSQRIYDKEVGENVVSTIPNGLMGKMSGTSFSTAIFSGKLVDKLSRTCNNR